MFVLNQLDRDYQLCTSAKKEKSGNWSVSCRLGLWSVSGRDPKFVLTEARRFWVQYFTDGEYNDFLAKLCAEKSKS